MFSVDLCKRFYLGCVFWDPSLHANLLEFVCKYNVCWGVISVWPLPNFDDGVKSVVRIMNIWRSKISGSVRITQWWLFSPSPIKFLLSSTPKFLLPPNTPIIVFSTSKTFAALKTFCHHPKIFGCLPQKNFATLPKFLPTQKILLPKKIIATPNFFATSPPAIFWAASQKFICCPYQFFLAILHHHK